MGLYLYPSDPCCYSFNVIRGDDFMDCDDLSDRDDMCYLVDCDDLFHLAVCDDLCDLMDCDDLSDLVDCDDLCDLAVCDEGKTRLDCLWAQPHCGGKKFAVCPRSKYNPCACGRFWN